MTTRPDVVVVGGGIGGLGAALALSKRGMTVRVLEAAPEFGEVGAGVQIAPNGTRILREYGLLDEAISLGVLPSRMVMRDAIDGTVLTKLDLNDLAATYDAPYLVIHRTDLHGLLLRACIDRGIDLRTGAQAAQYETRPEEAAVTLVNGETHVADVVIAADGLHSVARRQFVGDEPMNSAYVAYRGAVPVSELGRPVDLSEVVVHVGPRCHFVHYGLRGGNIFNQVAVFESPKALAGYPDWGTPDELDGAFAATNATVQSGIPHMWRDKWWRMYDRDPITNWIHGRIALLGDAAHPPLQYMAQGAVMALEDGWVLARHVELQQQSLDQVQWDAALEAYRAVRTEHCRRVLTTARSWGALWHLDGADRIARNELLRARDTYDYAFTDWIYGETAVYPDDEPEMFEPISISI